MIRCIKSTIPDNKIKNYPVNDNFVDADTLQNPFDQTKLTPIAEALQALIKLGYKPNDAKKIVSKIDTDEMTSEDIIKAALQNTLK